MESDFETVNGMAVQVRGDLPLTKCRVALDAVNLADSSIKEETSSLLADTISHLGQEVGLPFTSSSSMSC